MASTFRPRAALVVPERIAILKRPPLAGVAIAPSQFVAIAGQSQAGTQGISGSTGLPAGWTDTSRVQMWNNAGGQATATGSAFATYSPGAASTWGPEVQFALRWLADGRNAGKTLYLVKCYLGATQLGAIATYGADPINNATKDWAPATASNLFSATAANIAAARAALPGGVSGHLDVLWLQGESDSVNMTLAAAYEANLTALYGAIRSQWGDGSTAILAACVSNQPSYGWTPLVRTAQARVAASSALNRIVDTRGLARQGDDVHYTAASANTVGDRLYDALAARVPLPVTLAYGTAPLMWFDASDAANTAAAQWTDKSGSGWHALQATTGARPAISANTVTFATGKSYNLAVAPANYDLFAVATSGASGYRSMLWSAANKYPLLITNTGAFGVWSSGLFQFGTQTWLASTQSLLSARMLSGTPSGARNGAAFDTAAVTFAPAAAAIIGNETGLAQPFGSINEFILVPAGQATAVRQTIEGALAWKWDGINGNTALVTALPVGHPYKGAPPT